MYEFNLVRQRQTEEMAWVDIFEAEDSVSDPGHALSDAIREFLDTAEGKRALKETNNGFNWGDATLYIPDAIWAKHGLKLKKAGDNMSILVDQDEALYEAD